MSAAVARIYIRSDMRVRELATSAPSVRNTTADMLAWHLAEFAYRFNRRFHLAGLTERLIVAAATIQPRPEHHLRWAEDGCQSRD